jgi:hypothetical protein
MAIGLQCLGNSVLRWPALSNCRSNTDGSGSLCRFREGVNSSLAAERTASINARPTPCLRCSPASRAATSSHRFDSLASRERCSAGLAAQSHYHIDAHDFIAFGRHRCPADDHLRIRNVNESVLTFNKEMMVLGNIRVENMSSTRRQRSGAAVRRR